MNVPEKYIDLFEAYGRGELAEMEVRDFEARLSYDEDFKEAYNHFQQIESGIHEHYRNELRQSLKALDEELDKQSSGSSKIRRLAWSGASVAAVLLIGLFVYYQSESSNNYVELAERHWPVEEGLPVKMSAKGRYDDAMNAFKTENWQAAESELIELLPSDTAAYFLGIVSFERGNYSAAVKHFKTVTTGSKWAVESDFRLALAYLSLGEKDRAKSMLIQLRQTPNGEFHHEIRQILERI